MSFALSCFSKLCKLLRAAWRCRSGCMQSKSLLALGANVCESAEREEEWERA